MSSRSMAAPISGASESVPIPRLERTAEWIRQHGHHAHIDGDQIVIGIAAVERDGSWSTSIERVRTYAEARDALGY